MSITPYLRDEPVPSSHAEVLWRGIQRKRTTRRRRRWAVGGALFMAAAAGILLFVLPRSEAPATASAQKPAVARPAELTAARLALPDGSQVESQPGTELEMTESSADRIRLDLRRGQAAFNVVPNPNRQFSVLLPTVEVRVVGTRFSITVEERDGTHRTVVEVQGGVVEIRTLATAELLSRVRAGGRWSSESSAPPEPKPPEPESTSSVSRLPLPAAGPSSATHSAAAALFDEATRARRAGDYARAIRGYEALLGRYPHDRHAALAALELGRLKRTRAGDPLGAAEALQQAAQDEELNDDALAQLVLSYDQAGDRTRCLAAQQRYFTHHPNGVHAAEVRTRCRVESR